MPIESIMYFQSFVTELETVFVNITINASTKYDWIIVQDHGLHSFESILQIREIGFSRTVTDNFKEIVIFFTIKTTSNNDWCNFCWKIEKWLQLWVKVCSYIQKVYYLNLPKAAFASPKSSITFFHFLQVNLAKLRLLKPSFFKIMTRISVGINSWIAANFNFFDWFSIFEKLFQNCLRCDQFGSLIWTEGNIHKIWVNFNHKILNLICDISTDHANQYIHLNDLTEKFQDTVWKIHNFSVA